MNNSNNEKTIIESSVLSETLARDYSPIREILDKQEETHIHDSKEDQIQIKLNRILNDQTRIHEKLDKILLEHALSIPGSRVCL
jgi:hypothetical protein